MLWYIPLLIFFARICDVSINTMRTMLVISGHRAIATMLSFFEVVIWVMAAGFALKYLENPWAIISYAGGFSAGVAVGMWLEQRIALGYRMVQVVSPATELEVSRALRDRGYRVTRVEGNGRDGPVEIAYMVIRRRQLEDVRRVLAEVAPQSFITVERVDLATGATFPNGNGNGAASGGGAGRFTSRIWDRLLVRK